MNRLLSISLKIGLVNASFLIIYFLTIYFMGNIGVLDGTKFYDFWMPAVFIFIALKFFRDRVNKGELRMWQGLVLGIQITAINVIILGGFIALFMYYIDPNYMDASKEFFANNLNAWKVHYIEQNNMSIESFLAENPKNFKQVLETSKLVSVSGVVQDKMMTISFFGILYSFILSIFLRRNAAA